MHRINGVGADYIKNILPPSNFIWDSYPGGVLKIVTKYYIGGGGYKKMKGGGGHFENAISFE
jgi:hypothetical protein